MTFYPILSHPGTVTKCYIFTTAYRISISFYPIPCASGEGQQPVSTASIYLILSRSLTFRGGYKRLHFNYKMSHFYPIVSHSLREWRGAAARLYCEHFLPFLSHSITSREGYKTLHFHCRMSHFLSHFISFPTRVETGSSPSVPRAFYRILSHFVPFYHISKVKMLHFHTECRIYLPTTTLACLISLSLR